ncbi:histidine phosphatase family protein [Colwellia sp. RE-S-Sl-9]
MQKGTMQTTTIYLLRHGKVSGPAALYGQTDIGVTDEVNTKILTELNQLQQNLINKISHVVTSPLQRCQNVAQQFAKNNKLPINVNTCFQEMNFGQLDGISFDDIRDSENSKKTWLQLEDFWREPDAFPLPKAELLSSFYQRVEHSWCELLTSHAGKSILLVCHGGVIRMILALLLNIEYHNKALFSQLTIKNSSITLVKNLTDISSSTPAATQHSNVITISTPLKAISQNPEEFE